jgi:hypothetical protein
LKLYPRIGKNFKYEHKANFLHEKKIYHLKIQIDFFEPVLTPALGQRLSYRGQFGLTPVKNIFYPVSCGHKIPRDLHFMS